MNSGNRFPSQSKPRKSKPNRSSPTRPRQLFQSSGTNSKARSTDFLKLPREIRHKILQLSFDSLHLTSFRKSAYDNTEEVTEWSRILRSVDERLRNDIDYIEKREHETWREWNAKYLQESRKPGWVDEIAVAARVALHVD